jgi:hypothetical protein
VWYTGISMCVYLCMCGISSCFLSVLFPKIKRPNRPLCRSALVCNNTFASLLVDSGLHGHIFYSAPQIQVRGTVKHRYLQNRVIRIHFSRCQCCRSGVFLTLDPGSQTHIFDSLMKIFWVKSTLILSVLVWLNKCSLHVQK